MKVISKEPLRVATLSGAVVLFEAGVAREVGDEIGKIALTMGAEIAGDSPKTEPEPEPKVEDQKPLVEAMNEIINMANPDDFKADGTPKATAVNKYAGRTVSTTEREEAWEQALNS
jgi:hypothetical protein